MNVLVISYGTDSPVVYVILKPNNANIEEYYQQIHDITIQAMLVQA
jgi:hypothetical protein